MNIVYKMGTGEIVEKKSRFIAQVFYVKNEDEAIAYINEVKKNIGMQSIIVMRMC